MRGFFCLLFLRSIIRVFIQCFFIHAWHRWMDVRILKWTTAWNNRWRKLRPKHVWNKKTKEKKARAGEIRGVGGWKTRTGRRRDRTLRLRKMLFNPWVRPVLVVFTLICLFIDFVFSFNLSSAPQPSHPTYFMLHRVSSHLEASSIPQTPTCHSPSICQYQPIFPSYSITLLTSILPGPLYPSVSQRLPLSLFPKPLHEQ